MGRSLGDYMREKSGSTGQDGIIWTHKNPVESRSKTKKTQRKTSPTNIIYTEDTVKQHSEKVFKIENNAESKKKTVGKKFQSTSPGSKIIPGFSRKGR